MTISHGRRLPTPTLMAAAALLLFLNAGCAVNSGSRIALVSYKDPYFPESSDISLTECTYEADASGDLQITARCTAAAPNVEGPLERIIYLHVYWQPHPGKTFSNSTTTTATIHYVVATRTGSAAYTGTGFAYPTKRRGNELEVDIESGNMQLDASTGATPEALGITRLTGKLFARNNPYRTVDLMRQAELLASGVPLP
jgi:hypothetical protein